MIRLAETTFPKPILIKCKPKAVDLHYFLYGYHFIGSTGNVCLDMQSSHVLLYHSIFCTCSLILSISLFIDTIHSLILASTDLDPIVFTSRCISCEMKSNFRPTGRWRSNTKRK